MMKCPFCGEEDTRVVDSRAAEDNTAIRRRRHCDKCGKRFTTFEKLEMTPLLVVKKDLSRVPYDRGKLENGMIQSCHKRPVSRNQISSMTDEIENELFASGESEISSKRIGELVMEKLKEVDQVAYVRFASVYREFKDVNTFVDEIGKLLRNHEEAGEAHV